ncbi:hypothetical protein Fcan01_23046 [Folsomia candida]|uniref:Uncharacterized protein n=1 Tax=Folsomia candida TaxID=158441 RepID=A0A226D9Y7_FOLCA|nr:hypothetical protein Fcan01_23046 [Folsomia candida]
MNATVKKFVEPSAVSTLIKEFVGRLVRIKGETPSTREQKLFAKAIVDLVPAWRYPGTLDGIDILYDEVNRSGLLLLVQARLRTIHKNVKCGDTITRGPTRKRLELDSGGPLPKNSKV